MNDTITTEPAPPAHVILRTAKSELLNPNRWCKGRMAETEDHHDVDALDPDAQRFCLVGAVYKVADAEQPQHLTEQGREAIGALALTVTGTRFKSDDYRADMRVSAYNDRPERTHEEVMQTLDDAIGALS